MNYTTAKGRKVVSMFSSDAEAAAIVREKNSARPDGFATSLIHAFDAGKATNDQLAWLHILAMNVPAKEPVKMDFRRVALLFSVAVQHLKHPSIKLEAFTFFPGREGSIILLRTKPFRKKIGETNNHELVIHETISEEERNQLTLFCGDPHKYAAIFGQRSGWCVFCAKPLTTAESVGSGYGPVCAENWGLPWRDSEGAKVERDIRRLINLSRQMEQGK